MAQVAGVLLDHVQVDQAERYDLAVIGELIVQAAETSTSAPVSRNRRGAGEQAGQPAGEGSGGDVAVDNVFRAVDDRAGAGEVAAGPVARHADVDAGSPA